MTKSGFIAAMVSKENLPEKKAPGAELRVKMLLTNNFEKS